MSVLGKKWIIRSKEQAKPILDILLENRGLTTSKEKKEFLDIDETSSLSDPFEMPDMQKSVDRIMQAIANEERIIVFGDYDVDGLTSTAILFHTLKRLNAKHSARLPNREKDGYGLNKNFIDEFEKLEIKLIITVDCGVSCTKEISYAKEKGIETIITDHHTIPETPPTDAHAINHSTILTGAGVALKLAYALFIHNLGQEAAEKEIEPLIELAALGTVADIGVAQGENRLIIKKGLKTLLTTTSPGLKILKEVTGLAKRQEKEISTTTIGYQLAPRINAAGRIGDPYIALKLLIGENVEELQKHGKKLEELNQRRREMTQESYFQALDQFENIEKQGGLPYILIATHPNWHVGIIGLTAARLAERFGRPAIIMQDLGETLVASARSIEAFNVIEAIAAQKEHLVTFGGHKEAAGLTVLKKNYNKFRKAIEKYAKKKLKDKDLRPTLEIDCELDSDQVTDDLIKEINKLKPFGVRNHRPLFIIRNAKPTFVETVGREKSHVKFTANLKGQPKALNAIGFRLGEHAQTLRQQAATDLICHIDLNEWNGNKKLQLELVDFKSL
jgi:single-stranded-DNA-specific exonuclease